MTATTSAATTAAGQLTTECQTMSRHQVVVTMETLVCGNCAGVFSMSQRFVEIHQDDDERIVCPYCHEPAVKNVNAAKERDEEIREWQKAAEAAQRALNAAEDRAVAADTEAERMRRRAGYLLGRLKRIGEGKCVSCGTNIMDLTLAEHMEESPACAGTWERYAEKHQNGNGDGAS